MDREKLRSAYDEAADDYAHRFLDELDSKPADRELLDRLARRWDGGGHVIEVGCGPGQIARYLHDRGVDISGLDLSPEMVKVAIRSHPGIDFEVGDMARLPAAAGSLAGVVAFYSLIHIPRAEVPTVFAEWERAVRPGGAVVIAVHEGEGQMGATDFVIDLFTADELVGLLEAAGLSIRSATTREPYATEGSTSRVYVIAEKPVS